MRQEATAELLGQPELLGDPRAGASAGRSRTKSQAQVSRTHQFPGSLKYAFFGFESRIGI